MKQTLVAALALAGAGALAWAGGQQVVAQASPDGQSVIVRTYRCGTPSSLALEGRAEGVVDGERRALALEIEKGKEPGVFTVAKQWPSEGRWALVLTVTGGHGVSTLVTLEPGAALRIAEQRMSYERPTAEQVEAALSRASAVATR